MVEFLHRSPWARAAIPLVLAGIAGVFSSSLIVEVADGRTILWAEVYLKFSFYILLAAVLLSALYQTFLFRRDAELFGLTRKQFEDGLRGHVLPDAAKYCKRLLAEGKFDEFNEATQNLANLFEGRKK